MPGKTSFLDAVRKHVGNAGREAVSNGKSFSKGVSESTKNTIGDTLKLKGLKHLPDAVEKGGGFKKTFGTEAGRKNFSEALGKATPAIATGAAYGAIGKKIYDKTLGYQSRDNYENY